MKLAAYLFAKLEQLRTEGLLRDPADAAARTRLLGRRPLRTDGAVGSDGEVATLGSPRPAEVMRGARPGEGEAGIDATSNDYLGLGAQLVTVSRETLWDDAVQLNTDPPHSAATVPSDSHDLGTTALQTPPGAAGAAAWKSSGPAVALTQTQSGPSSARAGAEPAPVARAGAGASRLVQGTWPEHEELEAELASWVGAEAALLFSSGFAANSGAIAALAGAGAVVLSDELNHASIVDGCRLARAQTVVFPHLDLRALEESLVRAASAAARWVVTESYFSMDGDGPELRTLRALCDRHAAFLVVDEAHGLGVFGPRGAGRCAEAGVQADVLVGTLGKAVGTEGAFVAGSHALRTWLWNRARTFVFSTAPSPASCALTLRHVKQAIAAEPQRQVLHEHCRTLRAHLDRCGVPVVPGSFGPIVAVVAGGNEAALELADRVRAAGVLVQPIRPPTVPLGMARVRATLTAALSPREVARVAESIATAWTATLGPR